MKKLVYNSNTEKLEVLDYDTNKVKDILTGEERDVDGKDNFHFVSNSEKIYDTEEVDPQVPKSDKPDEVDLLKMVEPIKGQLITLVVVICIIFSIVFVKCGSSESPGEYEALVPTDTLPATKDDIVSYIRSYELTNSEVITNWRKNLIINLAVGLRRTRAKYIVDSLANDQPTKYKSR